MSNSTSNSDPKFELYRYDPTLEGAVLFSLLFLATTVLQLYQLIKTKTWYFIPIFIGGVCNSRVARANRKVEVVGYIGRIMSHFNDKDLGPFVMQSLLLLVAPALFAGSIYMVLGRLMRYVNAEHYSLVRVKWVTKLFVCGDILSFTIQGAGIPNTI
jgi:RTA1 like protein